MSARVLKWVVPIDGRPHEVGGGDVALVAVARPDFQAVTVWTLELPATPALPRQVQVFATGEPVDTRHRHLGSVVDDPYVWHLFELHDGSTP